MYTDVEVLGQEGQNEQVLEIASIGWDDEDDVYDVGVDGGPTYAKVQLFKGRDFTKPKAEQRAQGHHHVVRVPSGMMALPPKGTEVLIAYPGGHSTAIGAGVMVAVLSRVTGTASHGNIKEGEVCISPDANASSRILIKQTGTISIVTVAAADGSTMAIILNAADGSAQIITPKSAISAGADGILLISGQAAIQVGNDGTVNINCSKLIVNASDQVALNSAINLIGVGANAGVPTQAALHGTSGPAGVPSAQVFFGL